MINETKERNAPRQGEKNRWQSTKSAVLRSSEHVQKSQRNHETIKTWPKECTKVEGALKHIFAEHMAYVCWNGVAFPLVFVPWRCGVNTYTYTPFRKLGSL